MSVNGKLTALADSIRVKSGVNGLLSLDAMKTAVDCMQAGRSNGTVLESEWLSIYKETITVGANSITFSSEFNAYLLGLTSHPNDGVIIGICIHPKESYNRDNWGLALVEYVNNPSSSTTIKATSYRYRNGWTTSQWNNTNYNAFVEPGDVYDVFYAVYTAPN